MHTLNLHNAICQLYLNKAGAGNRIGIPSDSSKNNLKKIVSNIQITSWEIDGETVADFIFLGSKITADGDRSEIKKHLLLGRKVMTNLDSIFKSRDITWSTKVCLDKAIVFPVVMYGCELDCEES